MNGAARSSARPTAAPCLYENGGARDLGTLGGNGSSARDINDNGEIVGMAADANGQPQPFVFDVAMHALPGPGYSGAVAINNRAPGRGQRRRVPRVPHRERPVHAARHLPGRHGAGWRKVEPTGHQRPRVDRGTATTPSGDLRAFLLVPAAERAPVATVARAGRGPS
jgi:probable HAF family extracellular repeat protein